MQLTIQMFLKATAVASLMLCAPVMAQHDHGQAPKTAKTEARLGDPFPFDTCPISGKKLGSMGDAVVKIYDGREVRFCCGGCPPKFEKDQAASLAKLDEKIVKDQLPIYPLKTSVVSGKDLPEKPTDFAIGNRLIRVGSDKEKAEVQKGPARFLAELDKAVIATQGAKYPLTECPSSGEKIGGMGKAVDFVVAGRLVRLCCKECKDDVEKDPAKFVALVDAALAGKKGGEAPPKDEPGHKHGK